MTVIKKLVLIISVCVLTASCVDNRAPHSSITEDVDWNTAFIVLNGHTYVIKTSDSEIEYVTDIDDQIGLIEYYSDEEGQESYTKTYSNYFKEGTELYKIKGIDAKVAIAAKSGDKKFIKATRQDL